MQGRGGAGFILKDNIYYVIGGAGRNGELNDIWKIDNQEKQLTFENLFSPRSGIACLLVENNIFITGGQTFQNNQQFSEVYKIDLEKQTSTQIQIQTENQNIFKRNSHIIQYDQQQQQIFIYGGADQSGPLNDIWIFDKDLSLIKKLDIIEIDEEFKPREMHTAHLYKTSKNYVEKYTNQQEQYKDKKVIEIDFGMENQNKEIIQKINKIDLIKDIEINNNIQSQQEQNNTQTHDIPEQNIKQYLIVVGGRFMNQILDDIVAVDVRSGETLRIFRLPFKICAHASCLVENLIYIIGGTDGGQFYSNMQIYNFRWIFDIEKGNFYDCKLDQKIQQQFQQRIASSWSSYFRRKYQFYKGTYEEDKCDIIRLDTNLYNLSQGVVKI